MTTLPQQDTIKQFVGNGITLDFPITFYTPISVINGQPALDVYVTPVGQTPIPEDDIKVWDVDYTYTPALDPLTGGTLTFFADKVPPLGSVVTASRNVPAELSANFSNTQNFSGANLDDVLFELLMIAQQNKTYALQRNLSYRVNSYLPDAIIEANTQLPLLGENQIWKGQGDGVIATTLEENPDVSTLRSDLANDSPGTDGARLVGYYNATLAQAETVNEALDLLFNSQVDILADLASQVNGNDGALLVGYYDTLHATGKTVHAALSQVQTALNQFYQLVTCLFSNPQSGVGLYTINASPPTQSNGTLFFSQSFTPKSATSLLRITATLNYGTSVNSSPSFWIARDSEPNAIRSVISECVAGQNQFVTFFHQMVSGQTSPIVFKLYGGINDNTAGTLLINPTQGAAAISGMIIEEFIPYT